MTRARDVSKIFTTPPTVYYTDEEALNNLMRYRFVATGGETTISGVDANGSTLSYVAGIEKVYLNGALLVRGYDYIATNGTSITSLSPALVANDVIEVFSFNTFNVANTYTQSQVDGLINRTGSVLQVVTNVLTTNALTTSTTPVDTGFNISITPRSASSKLLITCNGTHAVGDTTAIGYIYITDSSNNILNRTETFVRTLTTTNGGPLANNSFSFSAVVASTGSTSARTYKTRISNPTGTNNGIIGVDDNAVLTIMEIAG